MKATCIAVAILISGVALAEPSSAPPRCRADQAATSHRPPVHLSAHDRRFMQTAAATNLAQIDLGQIAVQQGKTQRVRDFAQRVVDDHAKADDRLREIATCAGVTLPTELSDEQKTTEDRLWDRSERGFDDAYLAEVKATRRRAISALRDEAKHGRDPELKAFARSTLRSLEQHQQLASGPSHKL